MDGVPGFEPGLVESKSTVLPLDYTPVICGGGEGSRTPVHNTYAQ